MGISAEENFLCSNKGMKFLLQGNGCEARISTRRTVWELPLDQSVGVLIFAGAETVILPRCLRVSVHLGVNFVPP